MPTATSFTAATETAPEQEPHTYLVISPANGPLASPDDQHMYHTASSDTNSEQPLKQVEPLDDEEEVKHNSNQRKLFCWTMSKRKRLIVILCSVVLAILLLVVLVFALFGKSIAQDMANDVKLQVNYLDMSGLDNTSAENADALGLNMSLHVQHDAPLDAKLDATEVTMLFKDQPFGKTMFPSQTFRASNKQFDLQMQTTTQITKPEILTQMGAAMVNDEQIEIAVRGTFSAKAWIFHYSGLKLSKTVKLKAMNKFADPKPKINKIEIKDCGKEFAMTINVTIDNISQAAFYNIGQLNMSVFYDNKQVGTAISEGAAAIARGPNNLFFKTIIANNPEMMMLMIKVLGDIANKKAVFHISGDNPNVTQNQLLKGAFKYIQMDVLYTDGMDKVVMDPQCIPQLIMGGGQNSGSNPLGMLGNLLGGSGTANTTTSPLGGLTSLLSGGTKL